jgi:hypothetical protein
VRAALWLVSTGSVSVGAANATVEFEGGTVWPRSNPQLLVGCEQVRPLAASSAALQVQPPLAATVARRRWSQTASIKAPCSVLRVLRVAVATTDRTQLPADWHYTVTALHGIADLALCGQDGILSKNIDGVFPAAGLLLGCACCVPPSGRWVTTAGPVASGQQPASKHQCHTTTPHTPMPHTNATHHTNATSMPMPHTNDTHQWQCMLLLTGFHTSVLACWCALPA